jgi:hypothetical protein
LGLKLMGRAGIRMDVRSMGGWELWMLELGLRLMSRAGI